MGDELNELRQVYTYRLVTEHEYQLSSLEADVTIFLDFRMKRAQDLLQLMSYHAVTSQFVCLDQEERTHSNF